MCRIRPATRRRKRRQPLTVDETAPTAPGVALTSDTGSSSSDHITNNPALTLSSIESGAKVEYSLDGGTTWSTSAPTAQLVQGSNTVDVRQTDVRQLRSPPLPRYGVPAPRSGAGSDTGLRAATTSPTIRR